MERELTKLNAHNGFALVTVLIIAAVGLLIGAGSLLLFRFQCEKRIDRQHEIEKYFAVRSALQLLAEGNLSNFPDEMSGPKRFVYQTDSGRDVRVIISPAKVLFPDYNYEFPDGKRHFYMNFQTIAPHPILPNSYIKSPVSNYNPGTARYRFFTEAMTNTEFSCEGNYLSLMHGSECSTSNGVPRCWLKIDMSPTGRWSDDLFGRRYMFNLHESCEFKLMSLEDNASVITNDIYRLVLKRTTKNEEYPYAINDGDWRPKEDGEAVIYVELRSWQTYSNKVWKTEAHFEAYTQISGSLPMIVRNEAGMPLGKISDSLSTTNNAANIGADHARNGYGVQLVGRRLALYQACTPSSSGPLRYDLWDNGVIPENVYYHFTNNNSTVFSTNMVMVFEVEASPSRNGTNYISSVEASSNRYNEWNRIANFEVFPAYEYSIDIDYPYGYTNSATFVHLNHVGLSRDGMRSAITYDAHGTLNKGWRTDEKDWREYNEWLKGRPNTEANRTQWQRERGKFKWR